MSSETAKPPIEPNPEPKAVAPEPKAVAPEPKAAMEPVEPNPQPEAKTISENGLRAAARKTNLANDNQQARENITEAKPSLKPEMGEVINVFGDTYNLSQKAITADNATGPNIKGGPKSLATFMVNYGLNPNYKENIALVLKAFQTIFPSIRDGKPVEPFESLKRKPAYHVICNHMMYRMVTLKMEIQLQNRSSLRRNELESMYDRFDDFLKRGECGKISKAAAQEAFEREADKLFIASGSGYIATEHLESKLNYIISILNKFIDDGMKDRMEKLQTEGCDVGEMTSVMQELEGAEDVSQMMEIYSRINLTPGGLKVCLNKLRGQTSATEATGDLIVVLNNLKAGQTLTEEDINKLRLLILGASKEVSTGIKSSNGVYDKAQLSHILQSLLEIATADGCTGCAADKKDQFDKLINEIMDLEKKAGIDVKIPGEEPGERKRPAAGPVPAAPVAAPAASSGPPPVVVAGPEATATTTAAETKSAASEQKPAAPSVETITEDDLPVMPLLTALIYSIQVEGERYSADNIQNLASGAAPIKGLELFFPEKGFGFNLQLPNTTDSFKRKPQYPKKNGIKRDEREGNIIKFGDIEAPVPKKMKIVVYPLNYKNKFYEIFLKPSADVTDDLQPAKLPTPTAPPVEGAAPAEAAATTYLARAKQLLTGIISSAADAVSGTAAGFAKILLRKGEDGLTDEQRAEYDFYNQKPDSPKEVIIKTPENPEPIITPTIKSIKKETVDALLQSEPKPEAGVKVETIGGDDGEDVESTKNQDYRVYYKFIKQIAGTPPTEEITYFPLDTYNKKGEVVPLVLRLDFINIDGSATDGKKYARRKKGDNEKFKVKPIIDGVVVEGNVYKTKVPKNKISTYHDQGDTNIFIFEEIKDATPVATPVPISKTPTPAPVETSEPTEIGPPITTENIRKFNETMLIFLFKKANEEGLDPELRNNYKQLYELFNSFKGKSKSQTQLYNILRYRYTITKKQFKEHIEISTYIPTVDLKGLFFQLLSDRIVDDPPEARGGNRKEMNRLRWRKTR